MSETLPSSPSLTIPTTTTTGEMFNNNYNVLNLVKGDFISDALMCGVCTDLPIHKEIYECLSGHWFCIDCWASALSKSGNCILCNVVIASFSELKRSLSIEKLIHSATVVSCPNSFKYINRNNNNDINQYVIDPFGCNKSVKLENLGLHLSVCPKKFILCPNIKCKCIHRAGEDHQCPYDDIICNFCSTQIIRINADHHLNECTERIDCSCCSGVFKRSEFETHFGRCPEKLEMCKLSKFGCDATFKRKNIDQHNKDNNHIDEFLRVFQLMSNQLQESNNKCNLILNQHQFDFNQILNYQKKQIKLLNDKLADQQQTTHIQSIEFVIPIIGAHLALNDYFKTNEINISNFSLSLSIYPKGNNNNGKLSITIQENAEKMLIFRIDGTMKNHLDQSNNIHLTLSNRLNNNISLGWSNIISFDELVKNESGWINNKNHIHFHFTISLLKPLQTKPVHTFQVITYNINGNVNN